VVGIDGVGREIAAECRLGIVAQHRHVEAHHRSGSGWAVVGQQLGAERQHEHHREQDQRDHAAAVGAEDLEAPRVQRVAQERASKSMRGSMMV
jgi:hypothetical protein